jgi:hypothetical protein
MKHDRVDEGVLCPWCVDKKKGADSEGSGFLIYSSLPIVPLSL